MDAASTVNENQANHIELQSVQANENNQQSIESTIEKLTAAPEDVIESVSKIDDKSPIPDNLTVTYIHFLLFLLLSILSN